MLYPGSRGPFSKDVDEITVRACEKVPEKGTIKNKERK